MRPGVEDEREHVGFYLIEVLYRVIPVLYETLESAITDVYGAAPEVTAPPKPAQYNPPSSGPDARRRRSCRG